MTLIKLFFKCILLVMLLHLSHFFSPLFPSALHLPLSSISLPLFMSMGRTYKFFGFSIFYSILNATPSILYLLFMLLIPCTFPPFPPLPVTTDNPSCDLHFCDSVPVLVVCLAGFCFWVQLLILVSLLSFYCS